MKECTTGCTHFLTCRELVRRSYEVHEFIPLRCDSEAAPQPRRRLKPWSEPSLQVDAMIGVGERFTTPELAQRLGVPIYTINNTLRRMRRHGDVVEVGKQGLAIVYERIGGAQWTA